ncbi:cytochrome P450 [Xylariaceae sp. FL0662B]|nr:cytochrome P450 [Xylariaceae sp. FL0662B]
MLSMDSQPLTNFTSALVACGVAILLHYAYDTIRYIHVHSGRKETSLPPILPVWIPYLGSLIPFLVDCPNFLRRATARGGQLTSTRIAFLPGLDIYFFQDRETVKEIWKQSKLMKSVKLRTFFYKYIFGMPQNWLSKYYEDNSGPFAKPYPGTNVPPDRRIHHMLYHGAHQALAGPGFKPTLERFKSAVVTQIDQLGPGEDWLYMDDFRKFILHTVGRSFVQAVFGPGMLQINPTFMDDLAEFNKMVPLFSKALPKFLIPRAWLLRQDLKDQLKRWYVYAREHYDNTSISEDGDGDPFWGSSWMRYRQKTLASIQDDETLASSDLGVAWGSVVNMVPSTTFAMIHILQDPDLLVRVRREIEASIGQQSPEEVDLNRLVDNPLLCSIYAETLRLHVKLNTVINSQRVDLSLGRWRLPKGAIGLINTHICHMDDSFWNTKSGRYPVESFWAERFLTNPADPSSGPINLIHRETHGGSQKAAQTNNANTEPYLSMEGLEGSWVPYGGGHLACPGRFLAKHAIIFTCAILCRDFDAELLTDSIETSASNFGIGTEDPKDPVPQNAQPKI